MSASRKSGRRKDAAPRQINVSLTVDERDAINAAKSRLRRLIPVAREVTESDEPIEDYEAAICDLLDIMAEAVATIDATFAAADGREELGGARRAPSCSTSSAVARVSSLRAPKAD